MCELWRDEGGVNHNAQVSSALALRGYDLSPVAEPEHIRLMLLVFNFKWDSVAKGQPIPLVLEVLRKAKPGQQ